MRVLKYRKKVDTKKSKGGDHKNPISEWKDKTYEKKKKPAGSKRDYTTASVKKREKRRRVKKK